jgi:hypothetical protein
VLLAASSGYFLSTPKHGEGKTVYWLEPIPLGEHHNPTVNQELILSILRYWVSEFIAPKPMFEV